MPSFFLNQAALEKAVTTGLGEGVRVAVLDSGIDFSHPALANLKTADDLVVESAGGQTSTVPGDGTDVFGHGTAVAGIIHRIAPAAEIGSIRVLGAFKQSHALLIQEGAKQAVRRGYDILQCSFGAPARPADAARYKGWLDAAYRQGRHVVAASANGLFTKPEWPAHFPQVIAVGAAPESDKNLDLEENTSAIPQLTRATGTLVELLANGEEKEALWPGGSSRQVIGSSFAAPRATGLLCRLLQHYPDLHPLEAKAALLALGEQKTSHPVS